jgi:hypothetical protein
MPTCPTAIVAGHSPEAMGSSPPSDTEKWAPDLRRRSQEFLFWL